MFYKVISHLNGLLIDYLENLTQTIRDTKQDITSSIAYSVVDSSIRLKTKAIIANTNIIILFHAICFLSWLFKSLDLGVLI